MRNKTNLRPCPHYPGGIWKRRFISLVRPSVYTNSQKLSTENGVFRKCSCKRRNLKTELCVLVWTENIFITELYENDDVTLIRWFVCPSLPQTQIQNGGWNGDCHVDFATWGSTKSLLCACSRVHSNISAACDCCVFKFLQRSEDGKHFIPFLMLTKNIWCVFRVKCPFSNSSGVVWRGLTRNKKPR